MKFRTDFALYATSLKSLNYDGFYTLCRWPGGLSSIHATLYFIFSSRLFNKKNPQTLQRSIKIAFLTFAPRQ